jgi:hypothetical protein
MKRHFSLLCAAFVLTGVLGGCMMGYTSHKVIPQSISSPFPEFSIAPLDYGSRFFITLRDQKRNFRGIKIISCTLTDSNGREIPLKAADYIQYSPSGPNIQTPSHSAGLFFSMMDPKDPSKQFLRRPAEPFTVNLKVNLRGEIHSVHGTFSIKKHHVDLSNL